MTYRKFTPEEEAKLRQNKYVLSVSPGKINYSLEFKQFVMEEAKQGTKSPEIFEKADFDPEIIGKERIYATVKAIKRQAKSPDGLRASRAKSREECMEEFARRDYDRKHMKVAIRELQERIIYLEQQVELLKKR